jgi:hypothetical protein
MNANECEPLAAEKQAPDQLVWYFRIETSPMRKASIAIAECSSGGRTVHLGPCARRIGNLFWQHSELQPTTPFTEFLHTGVLLPSKLDSQGLVF